MKRFLSATSMSQLTTLPAEAAPQSSGGGGPRAYTREPTRPDAESEQTHDDCEWLDEEDREENVLRHWRDGYRRRRAPGVAQNECGDAGGQDNPNTQDRGSDGGNKRGAGLAGILAL